MKVYERGVCVCRLKAFFSTVLVLAALGFVVPTSAYASSCASVSITVNRISSPVFYIDTRSPGMYDAYVGYSITNSTGSAINDLWVKLESFTGSVLSLSTHENGVSHVGPLANGASTTVFFYLHATGATNTSQSHDVVLYPSNPSLGSATCNTTFSYTSKDTLDANANKVTSVTFSPNPPELGGNLTITVAGETGTVGGAGIFSLSPAVKADWPAGNFELRSVTMTMTGGNNRTDANTLFLTGIDSATSDYTQTYTFKIKGPQSGSTTVFPVNYINSGNPIKHTDTSNFGELDPIPATTSSIRISSVDTSESQAAACFGSGVGGTTTVSVTLQNDGSVPVTLDDLKVTLPTTPGTITYTASTSVYDGTAIPEPNIAGSVLTWYYAFVVPAGTTKTLSFDVVVPNTDGSYDLSAVGHIDSTQVDATVGTTDDAPATGFTCVGPFLPTATPTFTASSTPTPTATSTPVPPTATPTITPTSAETGTPTPTGTPVSTDADSDDDGIPDSLEGTEDSDGDGIPNNLDRDSDDDGIPDIIEGGGTDSNDDGTVDSTEDSDGDGLVDDYDPDNNSDRGSPPDTDGDGKPDYLDGDSDGDGIADTIEGQRPDTFVTPTGQDDDGDGIDNAYERGSNGFGGRYSDVDSDQIPDYRDTDSDGDGSSDFDEAFDLDGDGIADIVPSNIDADGDGVDDAFDQYRDPQSLGARWRESPASLGCEPSPQDRKIRRINRARALIVGRTERFAAVARSCGSTTTDAALQTSQDLSQALTQMVVSTCGGAVFKCPAGVCTTTVIRKDKRVMRTLARRLGGTSRTMKLRAIKACRTPDHKPNENDNRKNSLDYLADLVRAINGLPDDITRCS